jgi:predicted GTPase
MKNILLIGETGTGKSSLGNFFIGEDFFIVSNEPKSCTNKIMGRRSKEDENIFVIDTPGYNDTKGSDRKNFEDVLEYFNKGKKLELVLLTLNFQSARFPFGCQNFIKFLCNVFPKKFCYHFGIVFTHFDLDYQTKISKKNNSDPKAMAKKFVHEIMKLISEETKEELFLSPPVYFLDSLIKDDNSKRELNNLISFAKNLSFVCFSEKRFLY